MPMSEIMTEGKKAKLIDETVYNDPYVVKSNCLYEMVQVKDQVVPMKLADFVPTLISEITRDDGTEQKKMFKVGAVHKSGIKLSEQIVSADEMQNMKWLLNRWGALGAAQPKQNVLSKICHAIMLTKGEVKFETMYLQTGWKKINGEYVFLMPTQNSPFTVELQGKLKNYSFTEKGSQEDLIYLSAMLENSFAPQCVMLPLLAVTFLCPLNHFLKSAGCEPKFVTALIGKTGSRKSTLAALFLSFFGKFSASDLPMSFHDTANSILSNIYYLKDVLTCIDDFHPSGMFHEQEMKSIAQNISRYYGDRIGRARLNSKAELQSSQPPTGNAIITTDVGQHQMWAAQYYHYTKPRTFLSSGGLGTMGYGIGACIGAKTGCPDKICVNIGGDGCFRMNLIELATASRYQIPIIQIIINNHVLGMVRQWQTLFYGKRYSQTVLEDAVDYCKVAEGLGCAAIRVTAKEEVAPAIEKAIALQKPVVIDCRIPEDDKVFPMVPAGAAISEVFDGDDLASK